MKQSRYVLSLGFATAALLLTGAATMPAYAQVSPMDADAAVACQSFQRRGGGAWTATAPTVLNFDNGTTLAVRPGETFAPGGIIGGVEVTSTLDRHCGNL